MFEKIVKIFDENSMEKLHFSYFLRKSVAKNRTFGNTITFLQQVFPVRGGGGGWTPPCLRHCVDILNETDISLKKNQYAIAPQREWE